MHSLCDIIAVQIQPLDLAGVASESMLLRKEVLSFPDSGALSIRPKATTKAVHSLCDRIAVQIQITFYRVDVDEPLLIQWACQ